MNIKLVKNILLYGIGDFIVTGVSAFLFIPLYLKFLSIEEYGILNILNNNTALFTYIFQFGMISAFARFYYLKKAEGLEKDYTWNVIFFHLLFSFFLFLVYFVFRSFIVGSLSPSIGSSNLVYYSPLIAFLTFLPALYYINLRIEEKANKFVLYQILMVILTSFFILISYLFFELMIRAWLEVNSSFVQMFSFLIL